MGFNLATNMHHTWNHFIIFQHIMDKLEQFCYPILLYDISVKYILIFPRSKRISSFSFIKLSLIPSLELLFRNTFKHSIVFSSYIYLEAIITVTYGFVAMFHSLNLQDQGKDIYISLPYKGLNVGIRNHRENAVSLHSISLKHYGLNITMQIDVCFSIYLL